MPMHILKEVNDLVKKKVEETDDLPRVSGTDLTKIMTEENEQLRNNIVNELHDYLKKKDDRIEEMDALITSLEQEVKEKEAKIEQLKKIVSDALDKI